MKTTCADCAQPPLPGKCRCKACQRAHNERERQRRAERKKRKQCWACGKKALPDKSHCKDHEGHHWRGAA